MFDTIFSSVLDGELTASGFFLCTLTSVAAGLCLALAHLYKNRSTKSFTVTVALLPVIVQVIIMLVNGNLGTGIAVAGAFSLVRFRSVPGSAKEILSIFMAMAVGLATGVGYIGIAIVFTVLLVLLSIAYSEIGLGGNKALCRELKIIIPESLGFTDAFDDVFERFTSSAHLKSVKTTNMGSLYKLTYSLTMKKDVNEKDLIDELRCRNGNLEIVCNYAPGTSEEL